MAVRTGAPRTRGLTTEERRTLDALRERYRGDRDLFSARELARLRFVRWLVQSGRLTP
jgi:hypothetical protein